jgi:hypothetical protein
MLSGGRHATILCAIDYFDTNLRRESLGCSFADLQPADRWFT